ncbi:MAG: O-antigen ligase family protein [Clostridia bacterium]|nr:O-antigen ligase family protein [Clostridia bacterium]
MSETASLQFVVGRQDEKLRRGIKGLYAGLMVFCLLSYLWTLLIGAGIENMPPIIWYARMATVPLAMYLGRLWKNTGFRILAVYSVLFFLRCFIPDPNNIFKEEVAENILSALWLFSACYGMGYVLNEKQLKTFLLICAGVWIAGMTVLSCMGIYSAWTEQTIHLFGKAEIYVYIDERVNIVYLATVTGSMLAITILMAALIYCCVHTNLVRILLTVAAVPLVLALALTDSRTAYISISAGFGCMVFSWVYHYSQCRLHQKTSKHLWKSWALSIFIMFVVFVLVLLGIMKITPLFNQVKMKGIIPRAYAEEVEKTALSSRGFGEYLLTGRAELWAKIFDHFKQNPIALLIGESKLSPLHIVKNYKAHCHSIYIQVLLESGIPGLLLFLVFIVYTLIHAIRAIRDSSQPLWIRLLPAIPISLWVGDLAENFTWLRSSQCPMGAILCIAAGILCAQASGRKNIKGSISESN